MNFVTKSGQNQMEYTEQYLLYGNQESGTDH